MALTMTSSRPWRDLSVLLTLLLWLGVISPAMAGTVHCTTREDPQFKRLVTTCTDGSRAVTRYDEQFKRWRTEVITPGAAEKEMQKKTGGW
jgi:hypothetical protein